MATKKITLNELRNIVKKIINEEFVNKEWDDLYYKAQQEPLKTKIKKMLVPIFKDKNVMVGVADDFEWSDGSNGLINFDSLNHFITDIGFKSYADNPDLLNNPEELKKHILYSYASDSKSDLRRGKEYLEYKYNPNDEFTW